jgi:hypothetical protein
MAWQFEHLTSDPSDLMRWLSNWNMEWQASQRIFICTPNIKTKKQHSKLTLYDNDPLPIIGLSDTKL